MSLCSNEKTKQVQQFPQIHRTIYIELELDIVARIHLVKVDICLFKKKCYRHFLAVLHEKEEINLSMTKMIYYKIVTIQR